MAGLAITILTVLHVFAVFNLSFDPQLLLAGAAALLGLFGGRLNFSVGQQSVLALLIALSTGMLTSAIIGLMFGQAVLPTSFLEARLLAVFVGILFVAYLTGALLLPTLALARKPSHNR